MENQTHNHNFDHLDDLSNWKLEDEHQDIRGRMLVSRSGERIGRIDNLLVDKDHRRVAAIRLDDGRAFPIEPLEIRSDSVILDERAAARPATATTPTTAKTGRETTEERIPLAEEKLVVGKRETEHGAAIRVQSRTVEKPVSEQVRLKEEHVDIERRPVGKRVDDDKGLFRDRTVEMTEHSEEAVVGKETRVNEELVVKKEKGERVETVSDTVRRTEVDVEDAGGTRRR